MHSNLQTFTVCKMYLFTYNSIDKSSMSFFKPLGRYRRPEASERQLEIKEHNFFQTLNSVSVVALLMNSLSRNFLSAI